MSTDAQADIQMLTFLLAAEEYGVDVMKVKEVICLPEITRTHDSPHHVEGIINLRGSVIPVISLRKRFGLPAVPYDLETRIVVAAVSGVVTGIIVDGISEVTRIRRQDIQAPDRVLEQAWMAGIIQTGEKIVVVIDMGKM